MEIGALSPVVVALITAVATIIAAIISAIITKNGINFWRTKRSYKLTGGGQDLCTVSWRGDISDLATPFKYFLTSGTLEITNDKSTLTAGIRVCREDGTDLAEGRLRAFGINEGGVSHMSYQITDSHSNQQWQGVLLLRINSIGEINGIWLSDSSADPGLCTFGSVLMERR